MIMQRSVCIDPGGAGACSAGTGAAAGRRLSAGGAGLAPGAGPVDLVVHYISAQNLQNAR